MSSKSTDTSTRKSRSRSRSRSPSPTQQKTNYSRSIRNLQKIKNKHDFVTQQDLKTYLQKKYGNKTKDNWWKHIIQLSPHRIHATIADNKPALFDGKNQIALFRLVAIKKNAKEIAKLNKTRANEFIKKQQNTFLHGNSDENTLIKDITKDIIEKNAKILDRNSRLKDLGISEIYHENVNLPSDLKTLAQLRQLDLQTERRKGNSKTKSKRGGKSLRRKRGSRRVTFRLP